MTKTALVILSEIVQALEGVREVAYDLQKKGESRDPIVRSDVKIEAEELSEQSFTKSKRHAALKSLTCRGHYCQVVAKLRIRPLR
ncbi:MAG: hypothetical protein ACXW1N_07160 [Halobacteriota archaeon]